MSRQNKAAKNIFIDEKVKPGLALTSFRTILPCFQKVNLTCTRDPIENQHLVSGKTWARDMIPWYWNMHTSELSRECSSRLYFLRQFKRSGVAPSELVLFYVTCIRPVLEYASPAFHRSLPNYISEDLERIQRRALKIIYPDLSYRVALWKQLAYRNFMRGEKGSSPKGRVVNTHWDAKETSLFPNAKPSVWKTVLFLAMFAICR